MIVAGMISPDSEQLADCTAFPSIAIYLREQSGCGKEVLVVFSKQQAREILAGSELPSEGLAAIHWRKTIALSLLPEESEQLPDKLPEDVAGKVIAQMSEPSNSVCFCARREEGRARPREDFVAHMLR